MLNGPKDNCTDPELFQLVSIRQLAYEKKREREMIHTPYMDFAILYSLYASAYTSPRLMKSQIDSTHKVIFKNIPEPPASPLFISALLSCSKH